MSKKKSIIGFVSDTDFVKLVLFEIDEFEFEL